MPHRVFSYIHKLTGLWRSYHMIELSSVNMKTKLYDRFPGVLK